VENDKKAAYEALYKEYYTYIREKADWYVTDICPKSEITADDLAQETFLAAWRAMDKLIDHPNLLGWLLVTMKNKALHLRRDLTQSLEAVKVMIEIMKDNIRAGSARPLDIMSELSEIDAQVLRLFYLSEFSTREISKMLGITENAARARLHKARVRLRILLKKKKLLKDE
jgi:RNA polymerase sigma-70 factor (ECF subfamily)